MTSVSQKMETAVDRTAVLMLDLVRQKVRAELDEQLERQDLDEVSDRNRRYLAADVESRIAELIASGS